MTASNKTLSDTAALCAALLERASITPDDAGCNQLLIDRLQALGFQIELMPFEDVNNFWARLGDEAPVLCFAGHTDVVPSGPLEQWQSPPFTPAVRDGLLFGRGAADMKGSLAAMITACERFLADGSRLHGSLAFLITSDEEGAARNGTRRVMETLQQRGEKIDYCLVGEPSSSEKLGDIVKIGRRGSLHGRLRVHGVQGHVAYPQLADNPIHRAMAPLHALAGEVWDQGNDSFPPTTFQISNIHAGTGVDNVIPGELEALFNFRFSTELDEQQIRKRTEAVLDRHQLHYSLDWQLSGEPFLTRGGRLMEVAMASIRDITGTDTTASTSGGTSDGRFIAPTGAELIELGPVNASIHKVNEHVRLEDLDSLSLIYEQIMRRLLTA